MIPRIVDPKHGSCVEIINDFLPSYSLGALVDSVRGWKSSTTRTLQYHLPLDHVSPDVMHEAIAEMVSQRAVPSGNAVVNRSHSEDPWASLLASGFVELGNSTDTSDSHASDLPGLRLTLS